MLKVLRYVDQVFSVKNLSKLLRNLWITKLNDLLLNFVKSFIFKWHEILVAVLIDFCNNLLEKLLRYSLGFYCNNSGETRD